MIATCLCMIAFVYMTFRNNKWHHCAAPSVIHGSRHSSWHRLAHHLSKHWVKMGWMTKWGSIFLSVWETQAFRGHWGWFNFNRLKWILSKRSHLFNVPGLSLQCTKLTQASVTWLITQKSRVFWHQPLEWALTAVNVLTPPNPVNPWWRPWDRGPERSER